MSPNIDSTEERTEPTDFDRYRDQRARQLSDIVRFPEFQRNSEMRELVYDRSELSSQRVVVIGTNYTAENVIKQLLAIGFRDIYLWSNERDSRGVSIGKKVMKGLNHVSPYFRGRQGLDSLETRAITAGFDEIGVTQFAHVGPSIVVNTLNNEYMSDILLSKFLRAGECGPGLYIDAHTIQDHERRLYGMNIQTASRSGGVNNYDEFDYIENRDLSLFNGQSHDPLMAVICAAYTTAFATRYVLDKRDGGSFFSKPTGFNLFPFIEDQFGVASAAKEVHYDGFFGDKGIYVAGLGGGSLVLDVLMNIFGVSWLRGVDRDKLERTNMNRLIPFINEDLIGLQKTKVARKIYDRFARRDGRDIKFVDGVIYDDLLIGEEEENIDIIFGSLSGFDNKHNLVALSQKLAERKRHLLVDVGVEPFRFDITNYVAGETPCDYCRNLHDLAIAEYFANFLPNCDKQPTGSTVFSNYLGALAIVEAMKFVDPELGRIVTGSLSGDLLPGVFNQDLLYHVRESMAVDGQACLSHRTTTPLVVNPANFVLEEGYDMGWNTKSIHQKVGRRKGRHIGTFRYIPKKCG